LYYDAGVTHLNQRWDQTPPAELSVDETIR
jgi:hypothetical protein